MDLLLIDLFSICNIETLIHLCNVYYFWDSIINRWYDRIKFCLGPNNWESGNYATVELLILRWNWAQCIHWRYKEQSWIGMYYNHENIFSFMLARFYWISFLRRKIYIEGDWESGRKIPSPNHQINLKWLRRNLWRKRWNVNNLPRRNRQLSQRNLEAPWRK